jgi:multiple sugar transport system substrate-binding protein
MSILSRSAAALAAALALAAAPAALAQDAAAAKAPAGAESIILYAWDNEPALLKAVDAFNASQSKIFVEPKILPASEYETKLTTLLAAGTEMDVYAEKRQTDVFSQNDNGFIEPLDAYFAKTKADRSMVDAYKDTVVIDGKILGIPYRGGAYFLYYNKKLFKNAGIPTPDTYVKKGQWTWAKYAEVAKKLSSGDGKVYGALQYVWGQNMVMSSMQQGRQMITRDGKVDIDDTTIAAMKMRKDLEQAKAIWSLVDLKVTKTHYSTAFFTGTVGMLPIGEWFPSQIIAARDKGTLKGLDFNDWAITRLPCDTKDYVTLGVPTFTCVASASKHKDAAFAFAQWLGGAQGAKVIAENGLYPPIQTPEVKAIFAKVIPDAGSLAYYTEKMRVLPFQFSKYGSMQEQATIKVEEEYLFGKVDDKGLAARLRQAFEGVVADLK